MEKRILAECYADLMLLQRLRFEPNEEHRTIDYIFSRLKENYAKRIGVGVIDADKKINNKYYKEFELIEQEKHKIEVYRHKMNRHCLIKIKPAVEGFIQYAGESVGINRDKYFPGYSYKRFLNITKSQSLGNNQAFKDYLNAIIQKQPPAFEHLKQLLAKVQEPDFYR